MSIPCDVSPEAKRYSLTACFLVEIHKTILDHIVSLHDQLLTKKIREARHALKRGTVRCVGSLAGLRQADYHRANIARSRARHRDDPRGFAA